MTKEKVKQLIRKLPEHKKYIDVFTAILTVPIMLTVIITNFSSLKKSTPSAQEKMPAPPANVIKETVKIVPIAVEVTMPQHVTVSPTATTPTPTQELILPTTTPTNTPIPTQIVTPAPTTEVKTASDSAN